MIHIRLADAAEGCEYYATDLYLILEKCLDESVPPDVSWYIAGNAYEFVHQWWLRPEGTATLIKYLNPIIAKLAMKIPQSTRNPVEIIKEGAAVMVGAIEWEN